MEREVAPLIRNWKMRISNTTEDNIASFENENCNATLLCGGIEALPRASNT